MRSASLQSAARPAGSCLAFGDAVEIAVREVERLGLAATHQLAGFYAAPDAHSEGADFAATLVPRDGCRSARLKLLIACDGQVAVCPFANRCARPCKVASRC